jgi:general nucleoside transport system ATP-binding protein
MGLRPASAGTVRLSGRDITTATPRQRIRDGIGYVPEDRQADGMIADFSVADNMVLDVYDRPPYARRGIALDLAAARANATERVAQFDVRTTSVDTPAGTLSGGNQQKVILARELGRELHMLLASQPTRGLDVGSIEFVHKRIISERDKGLAVVIISAELDEIYALADRIAVMYEGRITGIRPPSVPVEELGMLMAGATGPDPAVPADMTLTGRRAAGADLAGDGSAGDGPAGDGPAGGRPAGKSLGGDGPASGDPAADQPGGDPAGGPS